MPDERDGIDRRQLLELAGKLLSLCSPARHAPGFGSVVWFGSYHVFTAAQARVIEVLWNAWTNGTPDVRQEHLLDAAGSVGKRLVSLFHGHSAWGTMIVQGQVKGTFRLAESSGNADLREKGNQTNT